MDERIWLYNAAIDGHFHCPADAVEAWRDLGFEPGDPPQEINPVIVPRLAQEQAAAEAAAAKAAPKPTTSARRGESSKVSES
jgi:hypothetical protein